MALIHFYSLSTNEKARIPIAKTAVVISTERFWIRMGGFRIFYGKRGAEMAKKGNRSKGRMEMLKKFERLERERDKARKKAEKASKKAERKEDKDGGLDLSSPDEILES